jgi:3-dehydroquinate dehydratase type I
LGLRSVRECLQALKNLDFAELRLDMMQVEVSEIASLFGAGKRLIATCRPGAMSRENRKALLLESIRSGAAFVDIEHDAAEGYRACLMKAAQKRGTQIIISYHDHRRTPSRAGLEKKVRQCFGYGPGYVKIACRADTPADCARLLGLLGEPAWDNKLIVTGMGRCGRAVRIFAPFLGSPFTYTSSGPGAETAPGQLSKNEIAKITASLERLLGD